MNRQLHVMLFDLILQCQTYVQLELNEKVGVENTQKRKGVRAKTLIFTSANVI